MRNHVVFAIGPLQFMLRFNWFLATVKFLDMEGHCSVQMLESLMKFITENEIEIRNCRGQSYDNATNMSGPYNGLQAKVKKSL